MSDALSTDLVTTDPTKLKETDADSNDVTGSKSILDGNELTDLRALLEDIFDRIEAHEEELEEFRAQIKKSNDAYSMTRGIRKTGKSDAEIEQVFAAIDKLNNEYTEWLRGMHMQFTHSAKKLEPVLNIPDREAVLALEDPFEVIRHMPNLWRLLRFLTLMKDPNDDRMKSEGEDFPIEMKLAIPEGAELFLARTKLRRKILNTIALIIPRGEGLNIQDFSLLGSWYFTIKYQGDLFSGQEEVQKTAISAVQRLILSKPEEIWEA